MSGAGKKKKPGSATAKRLQALLKKHQKPGMKLADVIALFFMGSPGSMKSKKAKSGKSGAAWGTRSRYNDRKPQQPWGTPTRYDHSKEQRPEEAATRAAATTAAVVPAQAQLVIVHEHKGRELESKDIVPYREGEVIPKSAKIVAVWSDAGGNHKRDVTAEYAAYDNARERKLEAKAKSEAKAQADAKKSADEAKKSADEAKRHLDDKHKADDDAKRARSDQHKAAARTDLEIAKNRDAKAIEGTLQEWRSRGLAQTIEAAKKAKIPTNSKSTIAKLVTSAIRNGVRDNKDYGDGINVGDYAETNPIYHTYEVLRHGAVGTRYHPGQDGHGKAERLERSTSNTEIDAAMSKVPGYQGCVASDDDFEVKGTPNPKGVSWVMNLDRSGEPGSHWVAVLITPHSVEYFDSFGDHPTPSVQERIVAAGKRLWPDNVKTLKINTIKHQDERTSTCGFHAMKFIRDRMSGQSFVDVTGYGKAKSQVRKSEAEVAAFEKRYPKFVQVGKGILDHPGDNMPDQVKYMLEQHGEEPVTSLAVVRTPVNSIITTILNAATLGAFKQALAKYHYDQLFHLFVIVNGKYAIEKNATVQFTVGTRSGERKDAPVPAGVKVADLFKRGSSAGFWLYDPRSNNCQDFVITVLGGVGALTPELRTFVKQDAVAIFANIPSYAGKLAKFVTDLGGRFEGAKDKVIKFFRGRGAEDTVAHINSTIADDQRRLEAEAKKRGITLNDATMRQVENPLTWLLRKVGAKKLAAWLHKKDTGQELQEGGFSAPAKLPGQYIGKPDYGNKGPNSWLRSGAAPRPAALQKVPL